MHTTLTKKEQTWLTLRYGSVFEAIDRFSKFISTNEYKSMPAEDARIVYKLYMKMAGPTVINYSDDELNRINRIYRRRLKEVDIEN